MKKLILAALLAISLPAAAHKTCDEPEAQVVWLRYDNDAPSKPPVVLTRNPGSAAGFTDYRVTVHRAGHTPLPGAQIVPWNTVMFPAEESK